MITAATAAIIRITNTPAVIAAILAARFQGPMCGFAFVTKEEPGLEGRVPQVFNQLDQSPTPAAPPLLPGPAPRFSLPGSFGKVGGLTVPGLCTVPAAGARLFSSWSWFGTMPGSSCEPWQAVRCAPAGTWAQS